jgi:hypothetical protein
MTADTNTQQTLEICTKANLRAKLYNSSDTFITAVGCEHKVEHNHIGTYRYTTARNVKNNKKNKQRTVINAGECTYTHVHNTVMLYNFK